MVVDNIDYTKQRKYPELIVYYDRNLCKKKA